MGDRLMLGLACFYVLLVLVFAYERQWAKCTYWLGALIITLSVVVMKA